MLIDPDNRKITINVEDWSSNIITNEFISNTDLMGYVHSSFKGKIRKFKCSGTIIDKTIIRYLETLAFDDIIEISIDIALDSCDIEINKETINGYISIESFNPQRLGMDVYEYTLNGYFFLKEEFSLHTITSYFNLGNVSNTSNSMQNQYLSVGIGSQWGSEGIIIGASGGQFIKLSPYDLGECSIDIFIIESGNNVCKMQIATYSPNNELIDISYAILNRGGFKIESNLMWLIEISNYDHAYYNDVNGLNEILTIAGKEIGSSVIFIGTGSTIVSSNSGFNAESILGTTILTTKMEPGTIITIISNNNPIINGLTNGGIIPTGLNCQIDTPGGGEIFYPSNGIINIPLNFKINDGSTISGIQPIFYDNYDPSTWSLTSGSTYNIPALDINKYRNGGYVKLEIPYSGPIKHAGVGLFITYSGWQESVYTLSTFSINYPSGGNAPIKERIYMKNITRDYVIFNTSSFENGIYDFYIYVNIESGRTYLDCNFYINNLSGGYSDINIISAWQSSLDNYFGISAPGGIGSPSNYKIFNSIDYGSESKYLIEKSGPINAHTTLFKRTVMVNPSSGSNIHMRLINIGSGRITGFTVIAVPIFSYTQNKFIGDCGNAAAPNIKNTILLPV